VGEGVLEMRIFTGPGYRVYFGQDGDSIIVLLCGSDKDSQHEAITLAKQYWQEHKAAR
jgi:putative addiction module killer protein